MRVLVALLLGLLYGVIWGLERLADGCEGLARRGVRLGASLVERWKPVR